jgi:hypothetical protein
MKTIEIQRKINNAPNHIFEDTHDLKISTNNY